MANKRELKKFMKTLAANMAGETVFIVNYYDNIDAEKADKIIDRILALMTEKINNVSVGFDKTCQTSFNGNRKEYRKAHRAYFHECYGKLIAEFNEEINNILKDMNGLLSKEQLEKNKEMANAK